MVGSSYFHIMLFKFDVLDMANKGSICVCDSHLALWVHYYSVQRILLFISQGRSRTPAQWNAEETMVYT